MTLQLPSPTDWVVRDELRLELSTVGGSWFDPDASLATLTLEAGDTAPLTLPTVERAAEDVFLVSCGEPLKDVVDGCWKDLADLGVEDAA